jgi:hypothetical protein
MSSIGPDSLRLRLDPFSYERVRHKSSVAIAGNVNRVARCQTSKFTTNSFAATPAMTPRRT